jgi:hypothetical protein
MAWTLSLAGPVLFAVLGAASALAETTLLVPPLAQNAELVEPAAVFDTELGQDGFSAAVVAYRDGAYSEAQRLFALLAAGEPDPARRAVLHVNAGTSAARSDDFGMAIWHLEAALRNAPRDVTARRNLDQVRARLGQASLSAASFTETLLRLPLWLTRSEFEQLFGVIAALILCLLCLRRRAPRIAPRLALGVCLLGLLLWVSLNEARALDLRRSVVVAAVPVLAEPRDEGKLLFRLDMGTIVQAEESRGDWQLVETDAGGRGWAPASSVRLAGR